MVRSRRRLFCEGLEARSLLSGLSYSLTTDQSTYQVGQTIQITFTETNTSDQPVTVEVAPTDFAISQRGFSIWQSNPGNANQPPTAETLQPGQSVTQTATWDGTTPYTPDAQSSNPVTYSLNNWGSFVISNPNAPQGVTATFQISDPISNIVTTDQSVYQIGQPVQMTYTETNTSDQPITFIEDGEDREFTLTHNGAPVFLIAYEQSVPTDPEPATWSPGQSFTETQTWNGFTEGTSPGFLTGPFVVGYGPESDPDQFSTTFQVEPIPAGTLATSVTTDQSVYNSGQPINMTFTETNVSDQPVTVVTGPSAFQVMQDGTDVWDANPIGGTSSMNWTTLQPGQSYTQTDTWDGVPELGLLSSPWSPFTVSDGLDPEADSATFQFAAPPASQLATSLTTNQSVYQLGTPIQMTFTQTNVGTQPIQVLVVLVGATAFDVQQDGTQIWGSDFGVLGGMSYSWETLQPGQSATQVSTWNGVPDQLPSSEPSGTFTVTNAFDPRGNSATFQIDTPSLAHLSVSLTTDQSVYDSGQPVQLTFTETNDGDQPITVLSAVLPAFGDFDLTQDGSSILNTMDPPGSLSSASNWKTLQPGQSYTQTYTWDGIVIDDMDIAEIVTGTYVVSNFLDPTGATATFQITNTPYLLPNADPPPAVPTPPSPPTSVPTPPSPPTSEPDSPSGTPTPPPSPGGISPTANDLTLSTHHQDYRLGQSVRITLSIKGTDSTNKGVRDHKGVTTPKAKANRITVMEGSTVIWRSRRDVFTRSVHEVPRHRTHNLSAVWNGQPNQPGVKKLIPGTYTLEANFDGQDATTTITLEPRLSKSHG